MSPGRATMRPGRGTVVALILAAQAIANIGPLGIPALAPLIRADLGLTLAQAGSFLAAYYVGPSVMSLPAGALADRVGVGRMLVLGQLVIAGGLVLAAGASSYPVLVLLLAGAGLGYGMLNPASTKAVMAWARPSDQATLVGPRGRRAGGREQVGLPLGGALGAALLPPLALAVGWRAAVAASAAAVVAGALATRLLYRDPPGAPRAMTASARAAIRAVLGLRDLWIVGLATLVFAGMQTVWMAFLVLYLQDVVGLSLLAASPYLALAQAAGMLGRVALGVLSDRAFGGARRGTLVIAGAGSALCSVGLAWTGPGAPAAWLAALTLVFGFTGIGWNGVQHTLMAELAGPARAGAAVGFGLTVSSFGVTLGPPLFGLAVERAGGYRGPWFGLAAAMLAAVAALAAVREPRRAP